MKKSVENTVQVIEVRSAINDNTVISFEYTEDAKADTNPISAGFERLCKAFKIDRFQAEQRYYVTKA